LGFSGGTKRSKKMGTFHGSSQHYQLSRTSQACQTTSSTSSRKKETLLNKRSSSLSQSEVLQALVASFSIHNHPFTNPESIILTKWWRIAVIKEITRKFVLKISKSSNGAKNKLLGVLEHEKASTLRCRGLGHESQSLSRISIPHQCLCTSVRTVTRFSSRTITKLNPYGMGFLFPPSLWMRLSWCMAIKPFPMDPTMVWGWKNPSVECQECTIFILRMVGIFGRNETIEEDGDLLSN